MEGYTSDYLIDEVKNTGLFPTNQNLIPDESIVKYLASVLTSKITPWMLGLQCDYMVKAVDIDVVAEQDEYPVPSDAIGSKLKKLAYKQPSPNCYITLPQFSFDQISQPWGIATAFPGFWMKGNTIVLYPIPTNTQTLRCLYFRRPDVLVPMIESGKITAIDTMTNTVTLDNVPTGWFVPGSYHVVDSNPPFGELVTDLTIVSVVGLDVTLSSVTGLVVGQYITATGQAVVAEIPAELYPMLVIGATRKLFIAQSDTNGAKLMDIEWEDCVRTNTALISPRVDDNPQKLVNNGGIHTFSSTSTAIGY